MNAPRENYRNKVAQVIIQKDGSQKIIHHSKKTPNDDYRSFWNQINKSPKSNSKRQRLLREAALTGVN